MANYQPVETAQISAQQNIDTAATFAGAQRFWICASADCYIDFDQPVATSRSFLIKGQSSTDTNVVAFEFPGANVQQIHAQGSGGSATVYIVAARS